ncbi:MAG TPA: sigma-54 dependent transcriptional regulator [Terriglobia bacterium]|nr:sigma-54 dependent transcriptional regulator [Terriglobia bacterium]
MPGTNGMELLKIIKQKYPETDVVIMTGFGIIPKPVEAIKQSAHGFVTKPFKAEELQEVFRGLMEKRRTPAGGHLVREQLRTDQGFAGMVGTSARMQNIFRLIFKAASHRVPILILGETGTGKGLAARAIHAQSPWKDKPFVAIDCGSLSLSLIESELFGHTRGAFTGADRSRKGLLASASGGTVFLDEIENLPMEIQAKLLRALQEHEVRQLGENNHMHFDARIVAACNQDIEKIVQAGSFRKDLFFRLNVITIAMPALRERKEDIPAIAYDLIEQHSDGVHHITGVSDDAMTRLTEYKWPGNIRELENCIRRAFVLAPGPLIRLRDLPGNLAQAEEVVPLKVLERQAIIQALEATRGNCEKAARSLGIGKTTIYRKLRKLGIENRAALRRLA